MLAKHYKLIAALAVIVCLIVAECDAAHKNNRGCTPLKGHSRGNDCSNIGAEHATCTSRERGKFEVYNSRGRCKWVCGTNLQCVSPAVTVSRPVCPQGLRADQNGNCRPVNG